MLVEDRRFSRSHIEGVVQLEDHLGRATVQPRHDHRPVIQQRGEGIISHRQRAGGAVVDDDAVVKAPHNLHEVSRVEYITICEDIAGLRERRGMLDEVARDTIDDQVYLLGGLPDAITADVAAVIVLVILAFRIHDTLAPTTDMVLALQ